MNNLNDILISHKQPGFDEKLRAARSLIIQSALFAPDSEKAKQIKYMVSQVAQRGDDAVAEYTAMYDNIKLSPQDFRVPQKELKKALASIEADLLKSLRKAIKNVRRYQKEIFIGKSKTCSGGTGIKYTPIKRVGVCVPGASAPLLSTVIMTAVPAQVAGVAEIAVVSPPRYNGGIHPVILAVCCELGIDEVYRLGGAQAVAALAYGTATVPKVDKIVGPGNQWVQLAKKEVFGIVDIDSIAGPSEVLIIADDSANPAWLAADMLSQAEHDPGSAILITDSHDIAQKTLIELAAQVEKLARAPQTKRCLTEFSRIIVVKNLPAAIDLTNDFASEHLQIQCGKKSNAIAKKIVNAGAIFIGSYSPVAVGDYWAGPSHTLPTGTSAKFFSALSSNDFIKATSIIEYNKTMLTRNAADIARLAQTESLDAHANSIKIRTRLIP